MNKAVRAAAWVAFAAVSYLISASALQGLVHLPVCGNIGFTLIFVLFALLHCAAWRGWRQTGAFFVLAAVVSYALEETGVRTGLIYGAYHYSDQLGPKIGHVPALIPLAWFMMIYPAWVLARALLRGVDIDSPAGLVALAAVAAMVMTAWDAVMDPGMSADGVWVWERGGVYFGVPLHNYFGWLLTTFLVYVGAGILWRSRADAESPGGFASLPIVVYALYAIDYVSSPRKFPALEVVALVGMGLPSLLALAQIWLPRRTPAEVPAPAVQEPANLVAR